ncbi:MAG: TIGR03435 family protein [Acidobacteriota bacterium]|nr:TIGR03435 family protein [Acidobacteriota bacterium]
MRFRMFAPVALCVGLWAQTTGPSFEVASVRPATPLGPIGMSQDRKGGPGTSDPGTYTCRNCVILWVLTEAYELKTYDYAAPEWMMDARFDFAAKVPEGTTKAAFHVMLQNLLAERFGLKVHRETRQMKVCELTVARGGPKLHEPAAAAPADTTSPGQRLAQDADGFPLLRAGMTMAIVPGHARMGSPNQPVSWLADMLSAQLHCPVADATRLSGKYGFQLSWSWDEHDPSHPYLPALVEAVQSQLGLKVQKKKGQVDVLVVDHIEKTPAEN